MATERRGRTKTGCLVEGGDRLDKKGRGKVMGGGTGEGEKKEEREGAERSG